MGTFTTSKQFRLGANLTGLWWLSGASIDLDFRNGRYYDSSLAALKQPLAVVTDYLSCSRASIGYAKTAAGVWTQFLSNVLRITDLGLLVEDARTNYLLQSETPGTQATESLDTGSYTLWVEGSGSATSSAGTATITGGGAATAGSPNTFSVTGAGTVVATVAGSLTRFQLENGAFASSYIPTTTTSAARAADVVTCTGNLNTIFTALPVSAVVDLKTVGTPTNGDRIIAATAGSGQTILHCKSNTLVDTFNGSSELVATLGNSLTFTSGVKVGAALASSAARSAVGGGGTIVTDTDTALALATPALIGSVESGALHIYAYIRRLTAWDSKLADATLQGLTAP